IQNRQPKIENRVMARSFRRGRSGLPGGRRRRVREWRLRPDPTRPARTSDAGPPVGFGRTPPGPAGLPLSLPRRPPEASPLPSEQERFHPSFQGTGATDSAPPPGEGSCPRTSRSPRTPARCPTASEPSSNGGPFLVGPHRPPLGRGRFRLREQPQG